MGMKVITPGPVGMLGYSKSTMQVCQIPVSQVTKPKQQRRQRAAAPMPVMKSVSCLTACKTHLQWPLPVVQLSWVYSFTC